MINKIVYNTGNFISSYNGEKYFTCQKGCFKYWSLFGLGSSLSVKLEHS